MGVLNSELGFSQLNSTKSDKKQMYRFLVGFEQETSLCSHIDPCSDSSQDQDIKQLLS